MIASRSRILTISALGVAVLTGGLLLRDDDSRAILAEMKALHQKIDGNAATLAGRIDNIEQRVTLRADTLDHQIAELRALNPTTATEDVGADIARARQDVQRLQQALAELHDARQLPAATTAGAATSSPMLTPEQIEAQAAQQQRAQAQLLENTLAAEARDPEWSISAEEKVRAGLSAVTGELTVNDLVCATTMCKLEASSTASDASEVFRAMNEHLAWDGEMFVTINLDEGHTTAWLAKPGATLPRADSAAQ